MDNVIKFEDLEIPALTEVAKESFEEALWATEKALAKQLEFGRVMLIVKSKLPYGEWGNWVRETFLDQMSLRNIQFHMKAHQEVAKNPSLLECANSLDEILTLTEKPRKPAVEVIEVAADEIRDIAAEVAAECGVTREQIIRDGEYAEAIDIVSQVDPDIQAKVRAGKVTQDDVIAAAKAKSSPTKAPEAVASGEAKKPAKAKASKPKKSQPVAPIEDPPEFDLDEETTRITDAMEKHLDNWPNIQWGSKAYRFLCTNVRLCISFYTSYPRTNADELSALGDTANEISSQIRAMLGNIPESDRLFVWREIVDSLSAQNPEHWTCKSTDSPAQ